MRFKLLYYLNETNEWIKKLSKEQLEQYLKDHPDAHILTKNSIKKELMRK